MKKQFLRLSLAAAFGLPASALAQNVFPTNGNVGIGTSAPDANLTINGSAYSGAESSFIGAHVKNVADGGDVSLWLQNSSKNAYIRLKNNYASEWLKIDDGTNARLVIDNDGKVGVGTTTPQAKFHVAGTALFDFSGTGGGQLAIGNNPNDNRVYIQAANSTGTDSAAEMVLAGYATRSLPKFSVVADVSAFSGKITTTTLELTSDRNQKQDSRPVSAEEILAKVATLPVSTWAYTNSPSVRHLGPMAQDFKAAFNLGEDDKHIGAGDGIGVALAAIQGLHELVQEKDSEIATLKRELAGMKQELAAVKDIVTDRLAVLELALPKNAVQQVKK